MHRCDTTKAVYITTYPLHTHYIPMHAIKFGDTYHMMINIDLNKTVRQYTAGLCDDALVDNATFT